MSAPGRVLVVWCPDWSVVAALTEEGLSTAVPAAVLGRNVVEVCNDAARAEGCAGGCGGATPSRGAPSWCCWTPIPTATRVPSRRSSGWSSGCVPASRRCARG
ncbi:hypothetical protein [Nocardioides zeae]